MTDEAKALDVKELCFTLFGCYMADAPEAKLLAHALAEARREGMEDVEARIREYGMVDFRDWLAQAQGGGG